MKNNKIICLLLAATLTIPALAQTEKQDKAARRLAKKEMRLDFSPKAGDISFGISANPLVNFVGNMFNGNTSNNLGQIGGTPITPFTTQNPFPSVSIMGKYMLTDNVALRANIGLISSSFNNAYYTVDDKAIMDNPLSTAQVTDHTKYSNNGGSVAIGAEYRVGKGRVKGIFGANLLYAYSVATTSYTYGNAITDINQNASIAPELPGYTTPPSNSSIPSGRVLKDYQAKGNHAAGLVLSVGVEWFVGNRISLGADVNLSAIKSWTPENSVTYEGFNTLSGSVEQFTQMTAPNSTSLVIGTGTVGANVSVNFYF